MSSGMDVSVGEILSIRGAPSEVTKVEQVDGPRLLITGRSLRDGQLYEAVFFPKDLANARAAGKAGAPKHVIIAGAPASGKGTQCEFIVAKFGLVHISTGDLLREAVKAGTSLGVQAKAFMDSGDLVPDHIIIGIVQDRLAQPDCRRQGWLLDGFPRTPAQAQALKDAGVRPDVFILLDVPDEALVERVTGRMMDPTTGKIYHKIFNPPPSAEITKRCVTRSDDTEEKVRVRLSNYHNHLSTLQWCKYVNIIHSLAARIDEQ